MRGLQGREIQFVKHYLSNLNAFDAAKEAGFSEIYAKKHAYVILRRPRVQEAIKAAQEERSARLQISADNVVKELAKVAFLDLTDVIKIDGGKVKVVNSDRLTDAQRQAIAEIAETDSGIKVKAHDKLKALELLGRHLGMFTDKLEHSGKVKLTTDELTDDELERIAALGGAGTPPPAPGPQEPA